MVAFAFLAGVTFCGLAASLVELAAGARLSFRYPFVSSGHVWRSLAVTFASGPFILINEAVEAWRDGHTGPAALSLSFLTAFFWALCMGIVIVEVATMLAAALG